MTTQNEKICVEFSKFNRDGELTIKMNDLEVGFIQKDTCLKGRVANYVITLFYNEPEKRRGHWVSREDFNTAREALTEAKLWAEKELQKTEETEEITDGWNETAENEWALFDDGEKVAEITVGFFGWKADCDGNTNEFPLGSWGGKEPALKVAKEQTEEKWAKIKEEKESLTEKTEPVQKVAVIIGCSATKLDHPSQAQDLYQGSIWQSYRKYENENIDCFALSALHGLISADTVLDPYDCLLGRDVSMDQLVEILKDQINQLEGYETVYVATSKEYNEALEQAVIASDVKVECWFEYLTGGIGFKRSKLTKILTLETKNYEFNELEEHHYLCIKKSELNLEEWLEYLRDQIRQFEDEWNTAGKDGRLNHQSWAMAHIKLLKEHLENTEGELMENGETHGRMNLDPSPDLQKFQSYMAGYEDGLKTTLRELTDKQFSPLDGGVR